MGIGNIDDKWQFLTVPNVGELNGGANVNGGEIGGARGPRREVVKLDLLDRDLQQEFDRVEIHKIGDLPLKAERETDLMAEFEVVTQEEVDSAKEAVEQEKTFQESLRNGTEIRIEYEHGGNVEEDSFVPLGLSDKDRKEQVKNQAKFDKANALAGQRRSERSQQLDKGYGFVCQQTKRLSSRQDLSTPLGRTQARIALASKLVADFVSRGAWSGEDMQIKVFEAVAAKVKELRQTRTEEALAKANELESMSRDFRFALDDVRRSRMQLVMPLVEKLMEAQAKISQNRSWTVDEIVGGVKAQVELSTNMDVSDDLIKGLNEEAAKLKKRLLGQVDEKWNGFGQANTADGLCKNTFASLDKLLNGELKTGGFDYTMGHSGFDWEKDSVALRKAFCGQVEDVETMLRPEADSAEFLKGLMDDHGLALGDDGCVRPKEGKGPASEPGRLGDAWQKVERFERTEITDKFEVVEKDDYSLNQYVSLRRRVAENVNPNPRTIDGRLTMLADAAAKALLGFVEDGWKPQLDQLDAEIVRLDDAIGNLADGDPKKRGELEERRGRLMSQSEQLHKAADELVRSRMAMIDPVVRAITETDVRYDNMIDPGTAIQQMQENLSRLKETIGAFRLDLDDKVGVVRGKWEGFKRWLGSAFSSAHGKVLNKIANVFTSKERIGFRHEAFNAALAKEREFNSLLLKSGMMPNRDSALRNPTLARSFSDTLHEINNSIRSTPPDLWLGEDFFIRMARKRLENIVPNGGSREFSLFVKGGIGFGLSERVKADVLAKGGANYQVRCEGDGTVVVRVQGKIGVEGMAKATFGDYGKLKGKVSFEGGTGVEYRYADMESAVRAIASSFMGRADLLRTVDTAVQVVKAVFYPIYKPLDLLGKAIVANESCTDAEFVQRMNDRGVLGRMAKEEPVVRKNVALTGYRPFLAFDGGGSVEAKFKLGGKNLALGDETTKRELVDMAAGAGVNLGGDIATQTEYRPYLVFLQQDVAGTARKAFEASIRRGGDCLLGEGTAFSLLDALKDDVRLSYDEYAGFFKGLADDFAAAARIEAEVLKGLSGNKAAAQDQLRALADRIRTTTEGVVALYEKWKASDACRNAKPEDRESVERSFTSLRQELVNPPIGFGDDFNRELTVEHSFDDNTFRMNFSAHFSADTLSGLTNRLMSEKAWLDDLEGLDTAKFFRRAGMKGVAGLGGYTALNFNLGFDTEFVKPTSNHLESWRNYSQTKLNIRLQPDHLETNALLAIIGTAIARQTGQKAPVDASSLLDVLTEAGVFGGLLGAIAQGASDLWNRVSIPLFDKEATSGTRKIMKGAKDFLKDTGVDFEIASGINLQLVIVNNRLQTVSLGTQDSVSLDLTVGEGFRFGVEYKDRNIVNEKTFYVDAPMPTLLDRCDRMTNGAQTSRWQEFVVSNRTVFAKLYDSIRDGLCGRLTNKSAKPQIKDYEYFADEIGRIRRHYEALCADKSLPWAARKNLMDNAIKLEKALLEIQRNDAEKDVEDPKGEAAASAKAEAVRTVLERIVGHYHILDVAQGRVAGNREELLSRFRVGDSRTADEAMEELDLIREEVAKFGSDDAVVRLTYTDKPGKREIASVREDKEDSVKGFLSTLKFDVSRNEMLKLKNGCDRKAILSLVCRACNAPRYIDLPKEVKEVFKIEDFNADGKPLTKRRLLAIVDAVNRAKENGSILKTRKPLEKGVVVQTTGSNCCFANAIVNGLKATEKGRAQLNSVIGEDGCGFFDEEGKVVRYDWPKDADWDNTKAFSPFETLVIGHMQSVDSGYVVTDKAKPPLGQAEKAAVMFGLGSDEMTTRRVDSLMFAQEIDEQALGKELSQALDKGEVVVCNRTGKHFEAITEVDLKTGLCKVVSDVADPYGGCVRWRNLKAVALEMIGVSTSFQFFHVK